MKIFIREEYGYRYWSWNFPSSQEDLVSEWRAGRTPRGIGFVGHREYLGSIEEVFVPDIDPDLYSDEEFNVIVAKQWEEILKGFDCSCHIHEEDDSYLFLPNGNEIDWEAPVDLNLVMEDLIKGIKNG